MTEDQLPLDPRRLAAGHEPDDEATDALDEKLEPTTNASPALAHQSRASGNGRIGNGDPQPAEDSPSHDFEYLAMEGTPERITRLMDRLKDRPPEVKLVVLLGYPTAGKTWFLQRLKWCHQNRRLEARLRKIVRPAAVSEGHSVVRTDHPTTHLFDLQPIDALNRPDPKRARRTFVVADLPGELFDRVEGGSTVRRAHERDEVVSFLKLADALIMMLPAEEVLNLALEPAPAEGPLPTVALSSLAAQIEQARKESRRKGLDKVRRAAARAQVTALKAEHGRMSKLRLEQCVEDFTELGRVLKNARDPAAGQLPVFLALSRADQIVTDDNRFDVDPWDALFRTQPRFAHDLQQNHLWSRVDFVTSFHGQPRDETTVRYSTHCSYGVEAVLDWIDWATSRKLPQRGNRTLGLTRTLRALRQSWANDLRERDHVV